MRPHAIRFLVCALALPLAAPPAVATDLAALPRATADAMAQAASPQAIAEYRRKLGEYQQARAAFEQDASETEFKRAYARVASAAGLTRDQAVRVYSFETGGNGSHDMQSGLSASRPASRAISTAIGYNQLLTTNSVELLAEQGGEFVQALTEKAARLSGAPRQTMEHKLAVLKQMVAFTRTVPDTWSEHEKL